MQIIAPQRQEHHCVQTWKAAPDEVFPLLCPVRETEWIPGWNPRLVVSASGVMEPECLFVEPDTSGEAIWVVTAYERNRFLEMYRTLPGVTVSKFSIELKPGPDQTTNARVSYQHTVLGEAGKRVLDEFTAEHFTEFMSHFETAINHYLITGKKVAEPC